MHVPKKGCLGYFIDAVLACLAFKNCQKCGSQNLVFFNFSSTFKTYAISCFDFYSTSFEHYEGQMDVETMFACFWV